jgi:hypothetical protein
MSQILHTLPPTMHTICLEQAIPGPDGLIHPRQAMDE